jgi:hypothetical protein
VPNNSVDFETICIGNHNDGQHDKKVAIFTSICPTLKKTVSLFVKSKVHFHFFHSTQLPKEVLQRVVNLQTEVEIGFDFVTRQQFDRYLFNTF